MSSFDPTWTATFDWYTAWDVCEQEGAVLAPLGDETLFNQLISFAYAMVLEPKFIYYQIKFILFFSNRSHQTLNFYNNKTTLFFSADWKKSILVSRLPGANVEQHEPGQFHASSLLGGRS